MTIQQVLTAYRNTLAVIEHMKQIPKLKPERHRASYVVPTRAEKYPWSKTALDGSFVVPCAPTPEARIRVMYSLTSCIAYVRRRTGKNFMQRVDPKGVRVRRIA